MSDDTKDTPELDEHGLDANGRDPRFYAPAIAPNIGPNETVHDDMVAAVHVQAEAAPDVARDGEV